MVQPFVLRRLKTDPNIVSDLPPKVEQDHDCELSDSQINLYKAVQEIVMRWSVDGLRYDLDPILVEFDRQGHSCSVVQFLFPIAEFFN
jgi:SNF2 family DNA or RNA helicase